MAADVDTETDGESPSDVDLDPSVQLFVGEDELHHNTQSNEEEQRRPEELGQGIPEEGTPDSDLVSELLGGEQSHLRYELGHDREQRSERGRIVGWLAGWSQFDCQGKASDAQQKAKMNRDTGQTD